GRSLLFLAVEARYADWVKIILDIAKNNPSMKLDVNQFYDTVTLLSLVLNKNIEITKLLLQHGADPNKEMSTLYGGSFPLAYAVLGEDEKTVGLLLEYGANPNLVIDKDYGFTITHTAASHYSKDNSKILPLLIEHGGDIYLKSKMLTIPLKSIKNKQDQ